MRRDPARLAAEDYEIVVVGGGIHGACAAWQAAANGLKVALIDAGDFGAATSSNSLRILHGGLRHLQRLDFTRMRESIRARREWLRFAPHLVRPMRFVLPTFGHGARGPEALRGALWVNDLVSWDRNSGLDSERKIGSGRVWSGKLARAILTGTRLDGCNGAAAWYDAVCLNSERLLLAVIAAAVRAGATAANYLRATGLTNQDGAVSAVLARDELTGREFEIRTRAVIDATGAQVGEWMGGSTRMPTMFNASKAFNLLTRPFPFKDGMGFAAESPGRGLHTYFIVPWNGRALIGTRHLPCDRSARSAVVTRDEVVDFIADLNSVLGRYRLSGSDVIGLFSGLLPEQEGSSGPNVELQRAPEIVDHGSSGVEGVYSVIGVKWTTSRTVAARAVRAACGYLGRPAPRGAGESLPLTHLDNHLDEVYGPSRGELLELLNRDAALAAKVVPDLPVSKAQILHCVREEMAVQLADVVMRRTPLYLSEALDGYTLSACAAIAASELGWDPHESRQQVERAESELLSFRAPNLSTLRAAEPVRMPRILSTS